MNEFKIMAFTRMCLESFADAVGEALDTLPNIDIVLSDKTDYCGKMTIFGNDEMEYAHLALDMYNIRILAEVDEIDLEQAVIETVYHEWIHYVHAIAHAVNYDMMMCHDGELWDSMITIGMAKGFIHRKDI